MLPSTTKLLVSGGDRRIALDPQSGANRYGTRPLPDPELVQLGSSTASTITEHGWLAADALHRTLQVALIRDDDAAVYAEGMAQLRRAMLSMLGCEADDTQAVFAASGTDMLLLVGQWLGPGCTVMIDPAESGSGVPLALRGRHFDSQSAGGASQTPDAQVGAWRGVLRTLAVRNGDGSTRASHDINADCEAAVDAAAGSGQEVLLVVTDVSKTGMIVPDIECALKLRRRWPKQVRILVDACQFRLSSATVRGYLAQDCLVAVTGSKFLGGPTFCGALLVPAASVARLSRQALGKACAAYSQAADWPPGWEAARDLANGANFGLLLRWHAALAEWSCFVRLEPVALNNKVLDCVSALRARLAGDSRFEALPVPPLRRTALGTQAGWDGEQTIFPFLILNHGQPLSHQQCVRLQMLLREGGMGVPRYALGQRVACGTRDGVAVSALRLCLGAPLLATLKSEAIISLAMAALDRTALLSMQL